MKKFSIGTRIESIGLACTAVGEVLLSGGVLACILYLFLTLASLVTVQRAFAQSAPVAAGVRLEAGIEKEDVDGDLKAAMEIYQKIAADTAAPRDVRAKALLRLAGCDEKLGRQAKQIYEQIVHDYADQPAAAQARNRLTLLKKQENPATPTTMSVHKIEWAGLGEMSACDTDGHRAVYRAADGNLYLGDLNGENKRLVFKVQPGDAPLWCASRDLSMTALIFPPKPNRPGTLAVVKSDGTGYRELVQDNAHVSVLGGDRGFALNWSWDTRHLLVSARLPGGGSHVMIVDAADGRRRELVRPQIGSVAYAAFSPDGHSVAYLTWTGTGSRIFVVPTDGMAEPQQVYQSHHTDAGLTEYDSLRLHDWTADGRYLVISHVQFGKHALFLLPMKSGAAAGSPVFVRDGDVEEAHATASGGLIFKDQPAHSDNWNFFRAILDPDGKLGAWQPMAIRHGNHDWFPLPSFSPDGAQIAYVSGDEEKGGTDLILRNLATGEERVLYWFDSAEPFCQFAYGLPKIFCFLGWGENGGHSDLISVSTESGAVERLASFSDYRWVPNLSNDDQRIYFMAMKSPDRGQFLSWEMRTRQDMVINAVTAELHEYYKPTPDERWLIREDSRGLAIRPMSGGDWRFLVSSAAGVLSYPQDSVSYARWVLFDAEDSAGKLRMYRIPFSGGDPQLIGDFPATSMPEPHFEGLHLSRDGRQVIAITYDDSKFSLWTLENFEPPEKK